jgi:hypothetical protein
MRFKDFYSNYDNTSKRESRKTPEQMFNETVGVDVPSLESFVAWLSLNKHIKPYVRSQGKPVPLNSLSENKKILYLVRKLPKIRELATEFASKFGNSEYLRD